MSLDKRGDPSVPELDIHGIWWLPEKPDERRSGTLRYSEQSGALLDLFGNFPVNNTGEKPLIFELETLRHHEIILGIGSKGENLTLLDCDGIETTIHLFTFDNPRIRAEYVLVGALIDSPLTVKSLSSRLDNLNVWVGSSGFTVSPLFPKGWRMEHQHPDGTFCQLPGFAVGFSYQTIGPRLERPLTSFSMTQNARLQIVFDQEISLASAFNIFDLFRTLLVLGIGSPVDFLEIEGTSSKGEQFEQTLIPFKILYRRRRMYERTVTAPGKMLFVFDDIKDKFSEICDLWIRRKEILKPVYSLYFAAIHNPSTYVEEHFINFFQAAESYHRRTFIPDDGAKRLHKSKLDAISAAIPSEHRQWIKEKLTHSHEPTAADRLKSVISTVGAEWLFPSTAEDVRALVRIRNYFTHWEPTAERYLPPLRDLNNWKARLQVLVEMILLHEIGFSNHETGALFERSQRLESFLVAPE